MPTILELKEKLAAELADLFGQLTQDQKLDLAKKTFSIATIYRYCSGQVKEVRRPELAETLITAMKEILDTKKEVANA